MKNEKLTRKEIRASLKTQFFVFLPLIPSGGEQLGEFLEMPIIDLGLKQAGWNVADRTQVVGEFDILVNANIQEPSTSYAGRQSSDYVLLGTCYG